MASYKCLIWPPLVALWPAHINTVSYILKFLGHTSSISIQHLRGICVDVCRTASGDHIEHLL